MHPHASHTPSAEPVDPAIIAAGHEPSEVGIKRIFLFGVGLIVSAIIIQVTLGGIMAFFTTEEKTLGAARPTSFDQDKGQFPPPNLQVHDAYDMVQFRKSERATLEGYGWVDEKAGVARIPLERAMNLLVERGLPKVKTPAPSPAQPAPAQPSSK